MSNVRLISVLKGIGKKLLPTPMDEWEASRRAYQALAATGANIDIPAVSPRQRVLIAPIMTGAPLFVLREGIIGHALRLRGADVSFLICDEALPACDLDSYTKGPHQCGGCFAWGVKRYEWLGLHTLRLSEQLTPALRAEVADRAGLWPANELFTASYRGHPVGSYVFSSSLRYFLAGSADLTDSKYEAQARKYLHAAMLMVEGVRALLDWWKPDRVLGSHGIYVSWAPILYEAKRRGIPAVSYLVSYRRNTLRFHHNEAATPIPVENWPTYRDRPLSPEQNARVDEYIPCRRTQEHESMPMRPDDQASDPELERWLAACGSGKTFGMFTNIAWDAVAYSSKNNFDSMFDWVEATVQYFINRPRQRLLIKTHPAELRAPQVTPEEHRVTTFLRQRFPSLPDNVFVLGPASPISPYHLYGSLDYGLTHISTVTIEMALEGIPVLTSGAAGHCAGHGFTIDPVSQDGYFARLQAMMDGTETFRPDVEMARRYFYHCIFRTAIPFEFLDVEAWTINRLNIRSMAELLPGKNRHLDIICDGILRGSEFAIPE